MELLVRLSWGALALIHAAPAAVVFAPTLIRRLYGADPAGDVGLLLVHRGAMFLAVVAVCLYAAFEPGARRTAGLVTAISILSFLGLYVRAGLPSGALRSIALADVVALVPLGLVLWAAWGLRAA